MDGKEMRKNRNQEKERIYEEYAKAIRECGEKYIGHPVTDAAIYDIKAHIDHIANVLSEETGLNIVAGPVTVNGDGTIEVMQPIIMFPFGTCRNCGCQIMWVKTKAGKNMPVDPTMISYRRPGAGVKAKEKIVTPEGEVVCADKVSSESAEGFGYISHFATCKARNR